MTEQTEETIPENVTKDIGICDVCGKQIRQLKNDEGEHPIQPYVDNDDGTKTCWYCECEKRDTTTRCIRKIMDWTCPGCNILLTIRRKDENFAPICDNCGRELKLFDLFHMPCPEFEKD